MAEVLFKAAIIVFAGSALLACAAWLVDRLAPARFVKERHDLAVAAILTLPVLFAISLLPTPASPIDAVSLPIAPALVPNLAPLGEAVMDGLPMADQAAANPLPNLALIMANLSLVLWAVGALALGLKLAADVLGIIRLTRRAAPVSAPKGVLSQTVQLRRSSEISSPMVAGYFRPLVLVPDAFGFDQKGLAVLEHEIAHIRRRDMFFALAQRLIAIVFWWAPGVYVLNRVAARTREALCDERAAVVTGDPHALAHALLDAAAARLQPLALAVQSPRKSDLQFRVRALAAASGQAVRRTPVRLIFTLPVLIAAMILLTPRVGAASLLGSDLLSAVRADRISVVRAALDQGADPNRVWVGDGAALTEASRLGNEEMVSLLLQAGAEVDLVTPFSGAALINAAQAGHLGVVNRLLAAGADPNLFVLGDETPLINAAAYGHLEVARRLVEAGADPSLSVPAPRGDRGGPYRSPLGEARRYGQAEMTAWLESLGADPPPPATP
jgi:beta-lactamase regulating signal transducer with metallopeptidase domain